MLLQQLELENIRSYNKATIIFPAGSTILAGDVGAGKSSILLAIEFALFGTSRPDLPAETLLRNGAVNGSVELKFLLENREIIIKRKLKKERDSIKQLAGHLIINNIRKELMPIELKAEMINLLGYPEELASKNKNYIFRYTVYTPQEEMKLILQDDQEIRLDVLRKIFGLDKYKIIRDNLQLYLKQLRTSMAVLKTQLEPLNEQKQKLKRVLGEEEERRQWWQQLEIKLQQKQQQLARQQENINQLEQGQKLFEELKQRKETRSALREEKTKQLEQLKLQQAAIQSEMQKLVVPAGFKGEKAEAELEELERRKNEVLSKKIYCQEKSNNLLKLINSLAVEVLKYEEEIKIVGKKEGELIDLEQKIKIKEKLKEEINQEEEKLREIEKVISANQTLWDQSQQLKEKINSLDQCPTCLQQVSLKHKETILEKEEEKTREMGLILSLSRSKKEQLLMTWREQKQKMEELMVEERQLAKVRLELAQLREKKNILEEKKRHWMDSEQERKELDLELKEWQSIDIKELEQKIFAGRKLLENYRQKKFLEHREKELEGQIKKTEEQREEMQREIKQLELDLFQKKDLTESLLTERNNLKELRQEEKNLAVEETRSKTMLENLKRQKEDLEQELQKLQEKEQRLFSLREKYHWLDQHFLPLTYSIEKQVLLNLHHLFNQLFQEWFAILINDENIYSHLDEAFTPIIEQNGYEISFSNLSGGERTSAALAYRLALNRVINEVISTIKTKDLLILDEPTDGFSSEQLDKVRDVLEKLNLKQTIIVSHESKIESFVENVLRIRKEGQMSAVI